MDKIRIGTRQSRLALIQTDLVCVALREAHAELREEGAIEIVPIVTSGDKSQKAGTPLVNDGGKALFAKELEDAITEKRIDLAVHSMKDMPAFLPEGFSIPVILPRNDARDAFFSPKAKTIQDLPHGALVGTASPRRAAFALSIRPDLKITVIRGNVETRLKKLEEGFVDATFLAVAGLNRLGLSDRIQTILEPDIMLPAVGQGAVGIEIHESNTEIEHIISAIHCLETGLSVAAERAFLKVVDGTCKTPVAAFASKRDADNMMTLSVWASRQDGSEIYAQTRTEKVSCINCANALGDGLGNFIMNQIPEGFFDS